MLLGDKLCLPRMSEKSIWQTVSETWTRRWDSCCCWGSSALYPFICRAELICPHAGLSFCMLHCLDCALDIQSVFQNKMSSTKSIYLSDKNITGSGHNWLRHMCKIWLSVSVIQLCIFLIKQYISEINICTRVNKQLVLQERQEEQTFCQKLM